MKRLFYNRILGVLAFTGGGSKSINNAFRHLRERQSNDLEEILMPGLNEENENFNVSSNNSVTPKRNSCEQNTKKNSRTSVNANPLFSSFKNRFPNSQSNLNVNSNNNNNGQERNDASSSTSSSFSHRRNVFFIPMRPSYKDEDIIKLLTSVGAIELVTPIIQKRQQQQILQRKQSIFKHFNAFSPLFTVSFVFENKQFSTLGDSLLQHYFSDAIYDFALDTGIVLSVAAAKQVRACLWNHYTMRLWAEDMGLGQFVLGSTVGNLDSVLEGIMKMGYTSSSIDVAAHEGKDDRNYRNEEESMAALLPPLSQILQPRARPIVKKDLYGTSFGNTPFRSGKDDIGGWRLSHFLGLLELEFGNDIVMRFINARFCLRGLSRRNLIREIASTMKEVMARYPVISVCDAVLHSQGLAYEYEGRSALIKLPEGTVRVLNSEIKKGDKKNGLVVTSRHIGEYTNDTKTRMDKYVGEEEKIDEDDSLDIIFKERKDEKDQGLRSTANTQQMLSGIPSGNPDISDTSSTGMIINSLDSLIQSDNRNSASICAKDSLLTCTENQRHTAQQARIRHALTSLAGGPIDVEVTALTRMAASKNAFLTSEKKIELLNFYAHKGNVGGQRQIKKWCQKMEAQITREIEAERRETKKLNELLMLNNEEGEVKKVWESGNGGDIDTMLNGDAKNLGDNVSRDSQFVIAVSDEREEGELALLNHSNSQKKNIEMTTKQRDIEEKKRQDPKYNITDGWLDKEEKAPAFVNKLNFNTVSSDFKMTTSADGKQQHQGNTFSSHTVINMLSPTVVHLASDVYNMSGSFLTHPHSLNNVVRTSKSIDKRKNVNITDKEEEVTGHSLIAFVEKQFQQGSEFSRKQNNCYSNIFSKDNANDNFLTDTSASVGYPFPHFYSAFRMLKPVSDKDNEGFIEKDDAKTRNGLSFDEAMMPPGMSVNEFLATFSAAYRREAAREVQYLKNALEEQNKQLDQDSKNKDGVSRDSKMPQKSYENKDVIMSHCRLFEVALVTYPVDAPSAFHQFKSNPHTHGKDEANNTLKCAVARAVNTRYTTAVIEVATKYLTTVVRDLERLALIGYSKGIEFEKMEK